MTAAGRDTTTYVMRLTVDFMWFAMSRPRRRDESRRQGDMLCNKISA